MTGYEQLFSESLSITEIESIIKLHANHSKISAHIKGHELNIHVADGTDGTDGTDVEDLDFQERTEFITMNMNALSVFIGNCGRIIQKFADIQLQKPGVNRVHFAFADPDLYPTTAASNGQLIQRPELTYVYTAGLYATNALLNYSSGFCQRSKRALAYHRSRPENAYLIPVYEKYIQDEISKLSLLIDNSYSLMVYFLRNISSMIYLSEPEDIDYLTRHPDHIYGIIQMLCSCNAVPERFSNLLRDYILELFMSAYIPNPVRHDLFLIITKNAALRSMCFHQVKISMLLDDLVEYLRLGADNGNEYTSHFVCGVLFSAHMIRTKHTQIDDYTCDKLVCIICGILRYVNRIGTEIHGGEQSQPQTPDHLEQIFDEIKQCLLSVECFIQRRPDVLQTHLVHFVPYTFVNMVKAYPVPLTVCESMRGILTLCSSSPIFANYLATILDDDYLKTNIGFIVPMDHKILDKKRQLMKTLEDRDVDGIYVDPIQSTHILNMGAIPMSNGEVIFCDSYVMQTLLRSKPTNPYTNEPMTVDDFKRIQVEPDMSAKIKQICAEKYAFVTSITHPVLVN
jgi:hypothetical protein